MKISDTIKSNSVAIIGMSKNAGKTTVLNTIIGEQAHRVLGITSIGRDGESIDVATGTKKPAIYVNSGTIIATAKDLLSVCDITKEILDTTGILTPLGEVIITKAMSSGNIQIAGPSTVEGMQTVCEQLIEYGVELILIDGAINRKSFSVPSLCKEVILCSGASLDNSMHKVVNETFYTAKLLTLKQSHEFEFELNHPSESKYVIFLDCGVSETDSLLEYANCISKTKHRNGIKALQINGAITDSVISPIIENGLRNIGIIGLDSSKFLLSSQSFDNLCALGCTLQPKHEMELIALTVNPYSATGASFNQQKFMEELSKKILPLNIPIFDVQEGTHVF